MKRFFKKMLAATATAACLFLPLSSQVEAAVERNPVQVTNARWYPLYHIAPYAGWANDPNGFCMYNGEYHFFYQHYPYDTKWGPMHWGHVKSKDLVHWEHLPVALEPNSIYDADGHGGGCFSGSAIEKDGKLYILYTGHVDLPVLTPEGVDRIESQNVAISNDGVNFEKYEGNPVIYAPSNLGDIHGGDFRDPKMWKHGDKYYAVIGSKNKAGDRAQMLLFESKDLLNWNYKSIMAYSQGNEGTMWECPNFAEIDGQEAIIMSPIGMKPEGKKYLNFFQAGYMIGKLDYNTGVFTHGKFDTLDYGFDFYAPQVTNDDKGRCILIGWLDMWDPPTGNIFSEYVDGWSCMMTVPRELHIKNNKIISVPVPELKNLRISEKSYQNVSIKKKTNLDGVRGETGELLATIDTNSAKGFSIELRSGGSEKTVLSYDKASGLLKLNRDKAGGNVKGEREVKISGNKVDLQIFLDRSSIEIFINGGEAVMSTRVYPKTTAQDITFIPNGGTVNLEKVTFYKLGEGIAQPKVK